MVFDAPGQPADHESRAAGLHFAILGPLQVTDHGVPLNLGSRKQQLVLAALLCRPNSPVSISSLLDTLWPSGPPQTARKNIHVYISTLRHLLRDDQRGSRISYQPDGYQVHVSPAELDSLRFVQRARSSKRLLGCEQASYVAKELAEILDLWRGSALSGMQDLPFIREAAQHLNRQFLAVFEDWAEAELAAGGALSAIERITEVCYQYPCRERLRMQQMVALDQLGRRSEALAAFDELRQALAREFGLSPGDAVARLHRSLLEAEASAMLAASPVRSRNASLLPRDLPAFTGRRELTQLLAAALTGGERLAVVTGPVGVGKTALAVHTAHQLSDRFPDGCIYIRLRQADRTARSSEEILPELRWAVPSAGKLSQPGSDYRAWQLWLAEHQALVLLDDARDESEVRPLLPEVGESAVVVTSRSWLAGLDLTCRLRVPLLTKTEAMQLLERLIGPGRAAADRHAAERIVAATGLLPLALRLVGERLALLRHLPLRDFLARIEDAQALLDELTVGDRDIRALLAEAITELPSQARNAFWRLGRLGPAFTLSQAAAALDLEERTAERLLETLLEASVITVHCADTLKQPVVYELHVLTHLYAREMATGQPHSIGEGG